MKRVFIVHGWYGHPEEGWFPWLKEVLEQQGFEVHVPAMPEASHPRIESWVRRLAEEVGEVDQEIFFVGHSIGCQTILRYLQMSDAQAGGVICVAPWTTLTGLSEEELPIAKPWLEEPLNFEMIRRHSGRMVAIFSDNDIYVPLEPNKRIFEDALEAKIVVEHAKGHFSGGEDGIMELPVVVEVLESMGN